MEKRHQLQYSAVIIRSLNSVCISPLAMFAQCQVKYATLEYITNCFRGMVICFYVFLVRLFSKFSFIFYWLFFYSLVLYKYKLWFLKSLLHSTSPILWINRHLSEMDGNFPHEIRFLYINFTLFQMNILTPFIRGGGGVFSVLTQFGIQYIKC